MQKNEFESRIPVPSRKPPVPLPFSLVDDDMKNFIKNNEGAIDHLYKDTPGNITIGYGIKIPDEQSLGNIQLYQSDERNKPLRLATLEEKQDAWQKLTTMPYGQRYAAGSFDPTTPENISRGLPNLRMQKPDMEFDLEQYLRHEVVPSLRKKLPNFHKFETPARKVFADMEYNLGPDGFSRAGWGKLFESIDREDWNAAAQEIHSKGIPEKRNNIRKQMLEDAAKIQARRRKNHSR